MKKKSSKRSRQKTRAPTKRTNIADRQREQLSDDRRGPAVADPPRGLLQTLKARYPHLYEVMYRRVDSPSYLEFESRIEAVQARTRKRGRE
jgi:hypothetical protein